MTDKLFKTLLNEVVNNHNGWYGVKKPQWIFIILSGPYTGCWTFAKGRVAWKKYMSATPTITTPLPHDKSRKGYDALVAKNQGRLDESIEWAKEYIPASLGIQPRQKYDWATMTTTTIMEEATNHSRHSQMLDLHLLAGIAGREKVIEGLKVHPKRWEAIRDFQAPSTFKERLKYCKVFAETWSHNKAMKAAYPGVHPANIKHVRNGTSLVNFALVGIKTVFSQEQVDQIISHAGQLKHNFPKLRTKQFRSFLPYIAKTKQGEWGSPEHRFIQNVTDALHQAKATKDMCIQHEMPIPQYAAQIMALMEKETISWSSINKMHDQVTAEYRTLQAQYASKINAESRNAAKKHHAKGLEYKLFEGITPLVTVEDFTKEGVEMHHCIAGYWNDTTSHFFAFRLGEERASLQLRLSSKKVHQFYGPYNSQVSQPMKELLNKFLKANNCKMVDVKAPLGWAVEVNAVQVGEVVNEVAF